MTHSSIQNNSHFLIFDGGGVPSAFFNRFIYKIRIKNVARGRKGVLCGLFNFAVFGLDCLPFHTAPVFQRCVNMTVSVNFLDLE